MDPGKKKVFRKKMNKGKNHSVGSDSEDEAECLLPRTTEDPSTKTSRFEERILHSEEPLDDIEYSDSEKMAEFPSQRIRPTLKDMKNLGLGTDTGVCPEVKGILRRTSRYEDFSDRTSDSSGNNAKDISDSDDWEEDVDHDSNSFDGDESDTTEDRNDPDYPEESKKIEADSTTQLAYEEHMEIRDDDEEEYINVDETTDDEGEDAPPRKRQKHEL